MRVDGRRRRRVRAVALAGYVLGVVIGLSPGAAAQPTASESPAGTATATPPESPTSTAAATPTDTATVVPQSPSVTPTATATPSSTATFTATVTATPTRTPIPTRTVTPTRTATAVGPCGNNKSDGDEACDDGNHFGGDDCAANCTLESRRTFLISPETSDFRLQTRLAVFDSDTDLHARLPLITGAAGADGRIPVAVPLQDFEIAPVQTLGACTCFQPVALAQRFGAGNAGAGWIDCAGSAPANYELTQDHSTADTDPSCSAKVEETDDNACLENATTPNDCNPEAPHGGVCDGPLEAHPLPGSAAGSAVIWVSMSVWTVYSPGAGGCELHPGDPAYGQDGRPCTPDDPGQRPPRIVPITTGAATSRILDAADLAGTIIGADQVCGTRPCAVTATGAPFDCAALAADPTGGLDGVALGLSLPNLDGVNLQDLVVSYWLNSTNGPTTTPQPTRTPSATRTVTPIVTPSITPTRTPTRTASRTRTPTITMTRAPSNTPTRSRTPTRTIRPSQTRTPAASASPTRTVTVVTTRTFTLTPTSLPTRTPTAEDTSTATRTITPERTSTPSQTPTFEEPPTATETATAPAPTPSATEPPRPTASPTNTRVEPSATPVRSPSPGIIAGDVDGNSVVDAVDLHLLTREFFDGDGDAAGEVNGGTIAAAPGTDGNDDGRVNAADLAAILRAI